MSVMVFVFIHSVALVHLDKFRTFSFLKSFDFSLHYTCTVAIFSIKSGDLDIQCWVYFFLLCLLWMACIYIDYGRKFCHTLLVVFCKWDTSFTKLILNNGLSTTALSKFWMLQASKTLMSNRYVSKVQLGKFYFVREYLGFQTRYCRTHSIGWVVNG